MAHCVTPFPAKNTDTQSKWDDPKIYLCYHSRINRHTKQACCALRNKIHWLFKAKVIRRIDFVPKECHCKPSWKSFKVVSNKGLHHLNFSFLHLCSVNFLQGKYYVRIWTKKIVRIYPFKCFSRVLFLMS